MDRRQVVIGALGAAATTLLGGPVAAMTGIFRASAADYEHADRIIAALPSHSYVDIMVAVMNLKETGTTRERFNQRWSHFGNPLIVRFWQQTGHPEPRWADCEAWCATFLSWCLRRDGRPIAKVPESSQSYLHYGQKTTTPVPGDICVFTDVGDTSRGHVAVFRGFASADRQTIKILGGNQGSDGGTNCPGGQGQSLVKESTAPLKPAPHWPKAFGGFFRPPPRRS